MNAILAYMIVWGGLVAILFIVHAAVRWRTHVNDTPPWYQLAFVACCAVVATAIWLGIAGLWLGVITKDTATFWGGIAAAAVTLTSFLLGRFADEMTKAQTAAEGRAKAEAEHRGERLSLAYALYAEIRSNIEQQRKSFTVDVIDLKLTRMQAAATSPGETPSQNGAGTVNYKTASAPADVSQPFYKIATEKYDLIPTEAIMAIVKHYNIDAMASIVHVSIASQAFDTLKLDQKYQLMAGYYELLLDYDRSGVAAANSLAQFIRSHTGHGKGEDWNGLELRDAGFVAYAEEKIAWLQKQARFELYNALNIDRDTPDLSFRHEENSMISDTAVLTPPA